MLDLTGAFASFPVLHTERFVLRAATFDDAPAVLRIMGDPRVMRYFGELPLTTLQAAEQRLERQIAAFAEHEGIRWMITADDAYIGSCGFWRIMPIHERAEIGYDLDPAWWGRGVMPEVLRVVLGFGFDTMELHSVEAQIDPANTGSRRVLEKCGFVQEGYFRENYFSPADQRLTDTAIYALLRRDWAARR